MVSGLMKSSIAVVMKLFPVRKKPKKNIRFVMKKYRNEEIIIQHCKLLVNTFTLTIRVLFTL